MEHKDFQGLSANPKPWKWYSPASIFLPKKPRVSVKNRCKGLPFINYIGLVSKVYPTDKVVEEALTTAEKISKYSLPALRMCKDAVNKGKVPRFCYE